MRNLMIICALSASLAGCASKPDHGAKYWAGVARHIGSKGCSAVLQERYEPLVRETARKHGLDPQFFARLVRQESCFNPTARGKHGEYGLGQIKCATARGIGFAGDCGALMDARTNLEWSARYLKIGFARCGTKAGAAYLYNAGRFSSCNGRNAYTRQLAGA